MAGEGAPEAATSSAPAGAPRIAAGATAPASLLLTTIVAMLLVHGWFRALTGIAALLGAMALVRARRRRST